MQKKILIKVLPQMILSFMLLSYSSYFQAKMAYIPQPLRECVKAINGLAESARDKENLQELCTMLDENRILASDDMAREAVEEALVIIKKHKNEWRDDKQYKIAKKYLQQYLESLDEISILLSMDGEGSYMSWPASFVAHNLRNHSSGVDMMYLTSELACINNVVFCGNDDSFYDIDMFAIDAMKRNERGTNKSDASINFNPNMMTNSMSLTPTMIFGTGAAFPSMNAWVMSPSNTMQSPIAMQFMIPAHFKKGSPVALQLNFLVTQQFVQNGNARIAVTAEYMRKDSSSNFVYVNNSKNFFITQPTSPDGFTSIYVKIPLTDSGVQAYDFVHISVIRIAPTSGVEYAQDIFLAAAAFRYKNN